MRIRVHELAKELGKTNKDTIKILKDFGLDIYNHMSTIEYTDYELVKDMLRHSQRRIESLKIIGLFGARNYEFTYDNLVNIYVAENGSGKTTVLNILVGLLTGNIEKLRNLPFKQVKLRTDKREYVINKSDLEIQYDEKSMMNIDYYIRRIRGSVPEIEFRRLMIEYNKDKNHAFKSLARLVDIYHTEMPRVIVEELERMLYTNRRFENECLETLEEIRKMFSNQLLYMPTYRRIEEDLESLGFNNEKSSKVINNSRYNLINFGMSDIEDKLTQLTSKLKEDAMIEYSKMNAEILDDLLSDKISVRAIDSVLHEEKIEIIIGRIGKDKIKNSAKLIDFVKGNQFIKHSDYLKYYLSKLVEIYDHQKFTDEKIKAYIEVCNGYLVNKRMEYNEVLAEVWLKDSYKDKRIEFGKLSSGEKQILAMFSKLYLDDASNNIVVIDEPELSLSIKWQRRLLPDMVKSKKCILVVATTHSPFIYQNEFSDYAKELDYYEV